jgi:hypothetical protein
MSIMGTERVEVEEEEEEEEEEDLLSFLKAVCGEDEDKPLSCSKARAALSSPPLLPPNPPVLLFISSSSSLSLGDISSSSCRGETVRSPHTLL